MAVTVGEALHHAQLGVVLLENENVVEDVPVEDWLGVRAFGCYFSLENFIAALLPDLELIPVLVGGMGSRKVLVYQVLVVVWAQFKEHRTVIFVIVVVATVHNLENSLKRYCDADGFEVVFTAFHGTEFLDVVLFSFLLTQILRPISFIGLVRADASLPCFLALEAGSGSFLSGRPLRIPYFDVRQQQVLRWVHAFVFGVRVLLFCN